MLVPRKRQMLKIQRSSNGQVVFTLSGEIEEEQMAELEALIRSEAKERCIVLDLKDVTLVGRDAITLLKRCEADGIELRNCAGYVREWINREQSGS
jgi:anti-anti-sigma regulatory factor